MLHLTNWALIYEVCTCREYVKERKAFGKTILDLQTVKHKLAEMKTTVRPPPHTPLSG